MSTNGNALNAFRYEYNLTDHLGNVRLVFADLNGNGRIDQTSSTSTNEILQENHYYPFGMTHYGSYSTNTGVGEENRYRYNGKEINEELGLYAYGARWYDPTIARWTAVDPLAETAHSISMTPYHYVANNPIRNLDPDGLDWYQSSETGYYEWHDGDEEREGYSHIGGKGSLLGEFEQHIDKIWEGGIYSNGFSLDIAENEKGAILPAGGNFLEEFIFGYGPQVSIMLADHPYTGALVDSEADEIGAVHQKIAEGKTEVLGQMTSYGVGFGFFDFITSKTLPEQFVGSYTLNVYTSSDGNSYLNILTDSKSREYLFYRAVKNNPDRDSSNRNPSRPSGQGTTNTCQFYLWKVPIDN